MQNTTNFNLQKPDYNNVADIGVLNGNFDKIDKGLNPFYVATQSGANTYKVITGANKTTLANGYGIRVAIPSASDGTVSIIVDGCSAVPVKKANSNPVKNFKQNGVYSLTYYNSVFILASGGVDDVNFSASDLLENKSANDSNGEKVNGTMPNIGQQTATINAGGRVNISKGYHDGTGYVQANTMAKQMQDLGSTLTSANQLVNGVKAVDKTGKLITGTATIQSLGGVPFHKTVGKAHFEVSSGSYHMFHPQINFDYDVLEGYWYHTDMGDTKDSRHYFYINKRYWSTSDMYLLNALPYGKSKTNVDDNNPPSGSTSGKPGIWRRYCSNTTNINTYQLLNNPQISTFTYSSNPNLDITVISFAYKI